MKIRVQILLSTYNGEKFLEEQLESILNQKGDFSLKILVRDDGSQDRTLEILEKYSKKIEMQIIRGENIGVNNSLRELFMNCDIDCDYFAISDQDDVWLENKLQTAIESLSKNENKLKMFASRSLVTDINMNVVGKTQDPGNRLSYYNAMVQNVCPGHTQVFNKDVILNSLNETSKLILSKYMIEVEGIRCYPIEIENYYFKPQVFEDCYVHLNEIQKNHFGELYVHRLGKDATSKYKMDNRVCMGIVLSNSDNYFYSVLIRSARFEDDRTIFGPNNVLTHFVQLLNQKLNIIDPSFFENKRKGGFTMSAIFPFMENKQALFLADKEEDLRDKSYLMYSSRVGIGDENLYFRNLPLRTLIGKLSKDFDFKEKTLILKNYLESHNLKGEEAKRITKELTERGAKDV